MKNWRESNEYQRVIPAVKHGEAVLMSPEMSTGAFQLIDLAKPKKPYKLQLRHNDWQKEALRIHQELLKRGWDIPKIKDIRHINGQVFTLVEWWEGEDALERRNRIRRLPLDYYHKLGDWMGRLHNEKIDGKNVSVLNCWPRNTLIRPDESVLYIDLNKLYLTDFPEAFTVKGIVAETPTVSRDQAEAFLESYRKHRTYDFKRIFKWYLENVSTKYHDFWFDGEILVKGATSFKDRLEVMNLPADMSGMDILDLGYGEGMFSLACAQRGTRRVFAYDNCYQNHGPGHFRMSDLGKLLSVSHGFTENTLLYKHTDINTAWFINQHIPDSLRYLPKKKYDIVLALVISEYIPQELIERFFRMLSNITDCLYYESRQEQEDPRLRQFTTFNKIEYLGKSIYKCTRG